MSDFHIIHKVKRTPILRDGKEYDVFTCTECNEVVKEVGVPDKLPHVCTKSTRIWDSKVSPDFRVFLRKEMD